jgi:WG containing repeat
MKHVRFFILTLGIITQLGCVHLVDIKQYSYTRYPVRQNQKYGYINYKGEVKIPCQYDAAFDFKDDFAIVRKGAICSIIDTNNLVILSFKGQNVEYCNDGIFFVLEKDTYRFFDVQNHTLFVLPEEHHASRFYNNLCLVSLNNYPKPYKCYFVDKKGNKKIDIEEGWNASAFSDGIAIKHNRDSGRCIAIDTLGRVLFTKNEWPLPSFSESLAILNNHVIDEKGNVLFSIPDSVAAHSFSEGLCEIFMAPFEAFGYIDRTGKQVIPITRDWSRANPFKEGVAAVCKRRTGYGYIDKQGNWVIPPQYQEASSFQNGLALVRLKDGRQAYIDRQGKTVWIAISHKGFWEE